MNTAVS